MRPLLTACLLLVASTAAAQQIEVTPLVGYTTSARIDERAVGVQDLTIDRHFTWGAQAAYFITAQLGFEGLWMQQSTHVSMATTSGRTDVFAMRSTRLHGNLVYQIGDVPARVKPFVFGGYGANFLTASDVDNEAKGSWAVGGGVKLLVQQHVGIRIQARYTVTDLHADASSFCGPFGFCQDGLTHFEFSSGASFRF